METKSKIKHGWILTITAVIIYLLAIFWHPFGTPLLAWHIINLLVIFVGIVILLSGYPKEKKED